MPSNLIGHFELRLEAEHEERELERSDFRQSEICLVDESDSGTVEGIMGMISEHESHERPLLAPDILHETPALPPADSSIQAAHLRAGNRPSGSPRPAGRAGHLDDSEHLDTATLNAFDADWRRSFGVLYRDTGYRYEQLWPAYRYGAEIAETGRCGEGCWSDIERAVRHDWEQRNPNMWEQAGKAIRYAWHSLRVSASVPDSAQPA